MNIHKKIASDVWNFLAIKRNNKEPYGFSFEDLCNVIKKCKAFQIENPQETYFVPVFSKDWADLEMDDKAIYGKHIREIEVEVVSLSIKDEPAVGILEYSAFVDVRPINKLPKWAKKQDNSMNRIPIECLSKEEKKH